MARSILNEFSELFFPRLCVCCENRLVTYEEHICSSCLSDLPKTKHLANPYNKLEDFFAGRFPFKRIASFAFFIKEGSIQKIIHEFKYRDNPLLASYMGDLCGKEILKYNALEDIDMIVPVPLHPKRLRKRGYNQSLLLAEGISQLIKKPVNGGNLIRKINNPSQTKNSRFERWKNTKGIFEVIDKSIFEGRHILLVDDVITTGSTLETCSKLILESENAVISIFTLGSAI